VSHPRPLCVRPLRACCAACADASDARGLAAAQRSRGRVRTGACCDNLQQAQSKGGRSSGASHWLKRGGENGRSTSSTSRSQKEEGHSPVVAPRCCRSISTMACVRTRHTGTRTCVCLKLSSHVRLGLQILATREDAARQTLDEARASTAKRDKTLIEEVGEWGIEYRNAKEPVNRAIFEPGFANTQKEALNKQMLLPRRNTIQKDMPQWFQQDAKNMPDWCVLLRCCES